MRDRIESLFVRWGHFVYAHAWSTLGVALLLVAGAATQLPRVELDTSTESFLHEDDPTRLTYDAFRREFGRDERLILAIRPPEVFDLTFLEKLRRLHEELEEQVPKLQEVQSLINARSTRGEGDDLVVEDLFEEWPETPEELAVLRERALANPLYRNLLLSDDGRFTTVMIETDAYSSIGVEEDALSGFDDDEPAAGAGEELPFLTGEENSEIAEAVIAVVDRYRAPDFEVSLGGTPIMVDQLQKSMMSDMRRFTGLALITIALLLAGLFRTAAGVFLPLGVSVLSLATTLGAMVWVGIKISLPVQILPSFLLAVGVGGVVHILAIFYQARRRGDSKEDALAFSLGHSGLAVAMTSFTTAGGLLSFTAADIAPVADFGAAAPMGVLIALFLTLVLVPALIALVPMGTSRAVSWRSSQQLLGRTGDFAVRHAWTIALSSAGLLAIALLGALQLNFSHSPLTWFPEESEFRRSSELLNDELRGAMFLEVLVDTGIDDGLKDPRMLEKLDEMRRQASSLQRGEVYVGKTVSLADITKEIHQALNENRPAFYTIPQDPQLVAQELLLFENSGTDDLEDVVDTRFSKGRFTMKIPFVDALQYGPFVDLLESRFRRVVGDDVELTMTGLMAILTRTFTAVVYSMAKTYLVAFAVITPLMMLLVGRVGLGLLAMIPNLTPILLTLGLMGWTGIPLDAFTLLIGSIAIGLAVDDTIHFMHNFRRYHDRTGSVEETVRLTLSSTGQALLFTSLVLSTGFFIYMLASMHNLFYFGLLTGLTIILAFLADVVLAPALMSIVIGRKEPALASPETRSPA